jgi:hypothetical protein
MLEILVACAFNNINNINEGTLMMRIRELIKNQLYELEIKLKRKEK